MGMYHSTYFGFGALIARDNYWDLLSKFEGGGEFSEILRINEVGYLMAGSYDRDMLFLTTYCKSVELGEHMRVDPFSLGHEEGMWKQTLLHVTEQIKMPLLEEPAWFCVPDVS